MKKDIVRFLNLVFTLGLLWAVFMIIVHTILTHSLPGDTAVLFLIAGLFFGTIVSITMVLLCGRYILSYMLARINRFSCNYHKATNDYGETISKLNDYTPTSIMRKHIKNYYLKTAYYELAICYIKLGDTDKAKSNFALTVKQLLKQIEEQHGVVVNEHDLN